MRCLRWLRRIFFPTDISAVAENNRTFAGNHSSRLHEREQDRSNCRDLSSAEPHQIGEQLYESASLRDAIAKTGLGPRRYGRAKCSDRGGNVSSST